LADRKKKVPGGKHVPLLGVAETNVTLPGRVFLTATGRGRLALLVSEMVKVICCPELVRVESAVLVSAKPARCAKIGPASVRIGHASVKRRKIAVRAANSKSEALTRGLPAALLISQDPLPRSLLWPPLHTRISLLSRRPSSGKS
jgi:hypothetical protein